MNIYYICFRCNFPYVRQKGVVLPLSLSQRVNSTLRQGMRKVESNVIKFLKLFYLTNWANPKDVSQLSMVSGIGHEFVNPLQFVRDIWRQSFNRSGRPIVSHWKTKTLTIKINLRVRVLVGLSFLYVRWYSWLGENA